MKPRIAKTFRVRAYPNNQAVLSLTEFDGRENDFLVHASAVGKLMESLANASAHLAVVSNRVAPSPNTAWSTPLHNRKEWKSLTEIEPGPNGSFSFGMTVDMSLGVLRLTAPDKTEFELLLPPVDVSALIEGLTKLLAILTGPRPAAKH